MNFESNIKFFLFCDEMPQGQQLVEVPPYQNFNEGYGDTFEKDPEGKYFTVDKGQSIKMYNEAYYYLRQVRAVFGVAVDCRMLIRIKDDMVLSEDWKTVSNVGIDLASLTFKDEVREVTFETTKGGLLELLEKRWGDDYDLQRETDLFGNALPALPTVSVDLEPREIYRESRLFVEGGTEIQLNSPRDAVTTPFQLDYASDDDVVETYTDRLYADDPIEYGKLRSFHIGSLFYFIADREATIRINGKVRVVVTNDSPSAGLWTMDMVKYGNGDEFDFVSKDTLAVGDSTSNGNVLEYTFNDYEITVQPGESLAVGFLYFNTGVMAMRWEDTEIVISENQLFPATSARAVRPYDAFERLIQIITGNGGRFRSDVFDEGGAYENYLVLHGTWVRNMPTVINQGADDERRVQASLSLEKLYEAMDCLCEPLAYDTITEGNVERFRIRRELDTLKQDVGIRVGRTRNGSFGLIEVQGVERDTAGDDFYGRVKIGSTKTGEAYEEVNNLFSVCGNAEWNTINQRSESAYEKTTEFRTGAEDFELTRQIQYPQYPDLDTPYDDDWFVLDAQKAGPRYSPKLYGSYYLTVPTGVFSPTTNYNWPFTPSRLFLKHSYKISPAIDAPRWINESVKFINSNCNSSLVTTVTGEDPLAEDGNIAHSRMQKARYSLEMIKFKQPINQEIYDQLIDRDKRDSLVQIKTPDGSEYGYLVFCDTKGEGRWELIEAKFA